MTSSPNLPKNLQELYRYNNRLTILPNLPQKLISLDCNNNPLENSNFIFWKGITKLRIILLKIKYIKYF